MKPTVADPWAALTVEAVAPEAVVVRLERSLARERALREQMERHFDERTRELYFANEQLRAQHERMLQAEQHERARLAEELEIAQCIQASLLPREVQVARLEIAAVMQPCAEMGGDYYDIRRLEDGCWIGIGDVAGHGVSAGLVMLMVQCLAAALTGTIASASPSQVLARMNTVLFDNIRTRMGSDEHITATLLRFYSDGRVVFAGAHEDIVVLRASTGRCERIETYGTWLGVVPHIDGQNPDAELRLSPGDTLLLYTDGLTEARNAAGEQFGLERVCAALERAEEGSAADLLGALLASLRGFTRTIADDVTALVLRYDGAAARSTARANAGAAPGGPAPGVIDR